MSPESWLRLEPLVDEALDLTEAERSAFVDRIAAGDPELGREVAAFLAGESEARSFLTAPVDDHAAALFASIAEEDRSWEGLGLEGETVGPYRVRAELGRGGMGAVFLAERADGQFEQRVALKVVKRGMDSAEILERFRSERQILATLQHTHIARLLDGGVSGGGQPYFAMEHVDGVPLTEHSRRGSLSTHDRLRLFLQVCEAVEYAHRNLVVHRDLKPSNILVDAEGQVKLLDFGIAKVLDPASGDGSVTRREARPMTPRYAAPEQLQGLPVTTATDVYSLGVVLYELVAGRHPYGPEGREPTEVERAALHGEPEPLAEKGDLDSVVRMAMRKEPDRRYASVRALADDLQRYLDGRPVSARPDTLAYRATKFVRRHRVAVTSALVVALALIGGVAGTLWQARRAVLQARKAEEVKRFTVGLFELADPDAARGREITARELLDRGTRRIESELANQPEVQADMLLVVGDIHHRLGLDRESRPFLERALALRRAQLGPDDLGVAEAELALGISHFARGELPEAEKLFAHALETRRRRLGLEHPDTASALGHLGRLRLEQGDLPGAEALFEEEIDIQRRHQPASREELATTLTALGLVLQMKADLPGAERRYGEGLDLRRELFGDDHARVADSLGNLAGVMKERGNLPGAESNYRKVLALRRRLVGPTHELIADDLNNLGAVLIEAGRYEEAEQRLRESLDLRRSQGETPAMAAGLHNLARALHPQHRLPEAEALSREALRLAVARLGEGHPNVATVRQELARILSDRGQREEAEALARSALVSYRAHLPPDHPRIAEAQLTLGHVLMAVGRAEESEPMLREALDLRQKKLAPTDWRLAEARLELGQCLLVLGRRSEAIPHLVASAQALAEALGPRHPLAERGAAARDQASAPGERIKHLSAGR